MAYDFKEKIKPQGYFDKEDDSLLDIYALVRGSYNTLITDEWKIACRKGLTLLGAAGTSPQGVANSYTWESSTNLEIPLRFIYDKVQVLRYGTWKDVGTGYKLNNKFRARPWWDRAEIKDKLLMVNGETTVKSWTGGMAELASWTATTVTKKFAKQSAPANNFVFNATNKTLTQTDTDFITLGFVANQVVRIAGTTNNNGLFTINTVTSTVITFSASAIITNETIATTAAVIGVLGRETWAAERFATQGTMNINIGGTVFTYTGGFNTPTLTGLSADPSAQSSVGLFVYQPIATGTPTGGDFQAGQLIDILEVNINQAYYGYSQGRNVYLSKVGSFTDCAYTTTVRKAGEGGTIFLDNNCVGIAASKSLTQITAGKSDVYNITFETFSDGVTSGMGETIRVKKLETAYGQGAINADCFVKVKNGILYISQEPTIDFLGDVEQIVTQQAKPLSDPIKRLLNSIDLTDAQGVYTKNYAIYLLPAESMLLMYDMERGFWQPPQSVSGNSISLIGGLPHIHSATTDETYTLFSGLTDNGNPISKAAYTNVDTYGTRSKKKIYDEVWVEAMVNGAAQTVTATLLSGYQGATFIHPFTFGYDDADRFAEIPPSSGGMGSSPFGYSPLGSLFTDPTIDPEIGALKKIYKISSTNLLEGYTHQMSFANDESGSYFEIIAYGVNARLANDNNMEIKE